jgi:hypothetical protein
MIEFIILSIILVTISVAGAWFMGLGEVFK